MNIRHPQTISVLKITGIKSRQKSAMWPASHLAESLTMETKQKIKNFRILLPVGQDLEVGVFVVISD